MVNSDRIFSTESTLSLSNFPTQEQAGGYSGLVESFINKYANIYSMSGIRVTEEAMKRLCSRIWPGNIRQLEHTVEKAMILSDGGVLGIRDFDLHEQQADNGNNATTLESMERNAITSAIKLHGGNMSEVARRLGITRQTLYNKMRKYGI